MTVDREKVIRTAIGLLNEVGLEGLTLRRLAQELGVRAPTLYWHIKSKQELLDEMATTIIRDHVLAGDVSPDLEPWQDWMVEVGRGLRRMLLSYRDGAKVVSGTYVTDDAVLTSMETPLQRLAGAGFSLADSIAAWSTLYSFVVGFTIEEQAVRPGGGTDPRYQPEVRARRVDGDRFPLTQQAGAIQFGDFDERFDRGARIIVAGLERLREHSA
jgi:TetR/AcrR family transcriptional regulator, tetracycline repressor protein